MDSIGLIRKERASLEKKLEGAIQRREQADTEAKDFRAQIAELDGAERVLTRLGTGGEKPPLQLTSPSTSVTSTREAVLSVLDEKGAGVSSILEKVKKKYDLEINKKTAGNILWMLKNEQVARREGKTWYRANKNAPS